MDNEVDDYTRTVAAILTAAKDRSGLSFSKIADRTNIARATVVRILAGERPITTFYLHELSRVFDLSPGQVLSQADAQTSGPLTPAGNIIDGRFGAQAATDYERAIAKKKGRDRGEDPEP